MSKLTRQDIEAMAKKNGYEYAVLKAIIDVESGGVGFDQATGKLIIQFEPTWFKRKSPYTPSGLWSLNKVERQAKEWLAFNNAFSLNPEAAMESTSIGMMQVMGFHYKSLGFNKVGDMWDYAKVSEANQVELALRFIALNPILVKAIQIKDFRTVAFYYNGSGYEKFNYHTRLGSAYARNQ